MSDPENVIARGTLDDGTVWMRVRSNLGNVRFVTVRNAWHNGKRGVTATIDLLLPGESINFGSAIAPIGRG